jgi:hypothetical protein
MDADYDHYSMVESKEIISQTILKIALEEINFSKGSALLNYFALHKKSKNYGKRFSKILFFQKLFSFLKTLLSL